MVFNKKKWKAEYREKNREKINEYYRRYYQKNKLKHIATVQKWKKKNPEKIAAYAEAKKTPERIEKNRIYMQKWREKRLKQL